MLSKNAGQIDNSDGCGPPLAPEPIDASLLVAPTSAPQTTKNLGSLQEKHAEAAISAETIPDDTPEKGGKDGEGGEPASFAGITPSNRAFLETVIGDLPDGAVPLVTAKGGDPTQGPWIAYRGEEVDRVCAPDRNTYINCSSFFPREDGTVAATKALTAAYHFLVLDDVGTKVDAARITLKATWKIETSPGNFQVGFKLREPLRDQKEVTKLLDRIADAGLTDKGAKGSNRWARLPNGINGKTKYIEAGLSFVCGLFEFNADIAYSVDEILDALAPQSASPEPTSPAQPAAAVKDAQHDETVVYVPKPETNPVVDALQSQGLYKRALGEGKHDITCPWVDQHTDAIDSGTCYFEPDHARPVGGFKCQHSHGDLHNIAHLIDHLGLDFQAARHKPLIRSTPGELHTVVRGAEHVLSQQPNFYQAGGVIVRIRYSCDGEPTLEPVTDTALTLTLAELSDWKKYDGRKSAWVVCDPPERAVRNLLQARPYKHLSELEGFARQPFYRTDGKLVFEAGYDAPSRRLALFDADKYQMPEPTREAAEAALATLDELLGEFHFATEIDKAASLSAVLTAIVRPSLETAPAYHVAAPSPGSGKSLLCNVIARLASPSEPLRLPYPKDANEADKAIFASLLPQPPTIMFDDMIEDWKPFGIINSVLTAPTITGRILGVSKTATVSTRILFLGSGNNVGPVRDLSRRVVTINLNARSESPATLSYERDPMAALAANRERFVMAGLTIIEAFKAAGCPKTVVLPIASYNGDWADHCRHPLIWLGLPDPASALIEQVKTDPETLQLGRLFETWHQKFGDRPTKVRDVTNVDAFSDLYDALYDLPVVINGAIDPSRLGWFLRKHKDRPVGDFILEDAASSNRKAWRVRSLNPSPTPTAAEPAITTKVPEDAF